MDQQALQELITLFLKLNPQPSDEQFHALSHSLGMDPATLESISYSMLSEAEDILEDPISASLVHRINAHARVIMAEEQSDDQMVLDDPTMDPDDMNLTDVALNDGDPTDDDLGQQEETLDDGFTDVETGLGMVNDVSDVLTDDGVPDVELP